MDSIDGLIGRLKGNVERWEEALFHRACDLAKTVVAESLLEKVDEHLMKTREAGLKVEGFRERWITTLLGDIKICGEENLPMIV